MGLFYCAAPLSGAFGGLLATGLAQIRHDGYNRWPWIFIVEGVCLLGLLIDFKVLTYKDHYDYIRSLDSVLLTTYTRTNQLLDRGGTLSCPKSYETRCAWSDCSLGRRPRRFLVDMGMVTKSLKYDLYLTKLQVRMAVFNVNTILCSLNFFAIITPSVSATPNLLVTNKRQDLFVLFILAHYNL